MLSIIALAAGLAQQPAPPAQAATAPGMRLAQADGTFPGMLFCDGAGALDSVRVPITVSISGGRASYSFPVGSGATETGGGNVPDRQLVLTGTVKGRGISYTARYAGEVGGRGGTLTGSQTGNAGGKSFTRRCQMTLGNGRA